MNAAVNSIEYTASRSTQRACLAVIWARKATTDEQKENLTAALQNHPGVQSAIFTMKRPALIVVRFHPEEATGTELVKMVNRHGADARLVGC